MGYVEGSFDKSAWFFLPKDRKFDSQGPENIKQKKILQGCPMA